MAHSKIPQIVLVVVALLALAALACNTLLPTPTAVAPAGAGDAPPAEALGEFDCVGYEAGMLAGAGTLTIVAGGSVQFEDFDGVVTTGQWTYASAAETFTFSAVPLSTATLRAGEPGLDATVRPGIELVHAETGLLTCAPR